MTNGEAAKAFDEVYNGFWLNYRDKPLPLESPEWERMNAWAASLMRKHPFMAEPVAEMVTEIDQRARKR